MRNVIRISSFSSVSPLGASFKEVSETYLSGKSCIKDEEIEGEIYPAARLGRSSEEKISMLLESNSDYKRLDRSVLMTLAAGRELLLNSAMTLDHMQGLITIGSSRGATGTFEASMKSYLEKGQVPVLTSPTTTIGNLSTWLMQDLKLNGLPLSTSVTCSSALQAVLNSCAWLISGLVDYTIAGGSEAPLTGFTLAQMKALRIYAERGAQYPCMPCAEEYDKRSGMTLSEGAALFFLEMVKLEDLRSGDIYIDSFGHSSEVLTSATSISPEADAIHDSMKSALQGTDSTPDIVILHAPGTEQGDNAEIKAVSKLQLGSVLLSNKWIIGHTFGAAGAFNLEYAIHILKTKKYIDFPYKTKFNNPSLKNINSVMLNAAGFGGNAISIIVSIKN